MATMSGWGGRSLIVNSHVPWESLPPRLPPIIDPVSGKGVWIDTSTGAIIYDWRSFAVIGSVSGGINGIYPAIAAGGYLYVFVPTSATAMKVVRYSFKDWSKTDPLQTYTGLSTSSFPSPFCAVYDGVDYVYLGCSTSGAEVIYSYRISTNAFATVRTIASPTTASMGALGLAGGLLYFVANSAPSVPTYYSLTVDGSTLTVIDAAASGTISGWKGYNYKGTTLYNYNRSLSWALAEAPVGLFILDDVPATPKAIYTSASNYHEASGASNLVTTGFDKSAAIRQYNLATGGFQTIATFLPPECHDPMPLGIGLCDETLYVGFGEAGGTNTLYSMDLSARRVCEVDHGQERLLVGWHGYHVKAASPRQGVGRRPCLYNAERSLAWVLAAEPRAMFISDEVQAHPRYVYLSHAGRYHEEGGGEEPFAAEAARGQAFRLQAFPVGGEALPESIAFPRG